MPLQQILRTAFQRGYRLIFFSSLPPFFPSSRLFQVFGEWYEIEVDIVTFYSISEWKCVWSICWLQPFLQCRIKLSKSCPQHSFAWRCPRQTSGLAPRTTNTLLICMPRWQFGFLGHIPCHRRPHRLRQSQMDWYCHNTAAFSARGSKWDPFRVTQVWDRGSINTSQQSLGSVVWSLLQFRSQTQTSRQGQANVGHVRSRGRSRISPTLLSNFETQFVVESIPWWKVWKVMVCSPRKRAQKDPNLMSDLSSPYMKSCRCSF